MTNLATLLLAKLLGAGLITGDRRLNELATVQGLPMRFCGYSMKCYSTILLQQTKRPMLLKRCLPKGQDCPKSNAKGVLLFGNEKQNWILKFIKKFCNIRVALGNGRI